MTWSWVLVVLVVVDSFDTRTEQRAIFQFHTGKALL